MAEFEQIRPCPQLMENLRIDLGPELAAPKIVLFIDLKRKGGESTPDDE